MHESRTCVVDLVCAMCVDVAAVIRSIACLMFVFWWPKTSIIVSFLLSASNDYLYENINTIKTRLWLCAGGYAVFGIGIFL